MLEFLNRLPSETLGQNMLGFLELSDIIQLENASTSHISQLLLKAILPYCPPIKVSRHERFYMQSIDSINWFNKRRCNIQFVQIEIKTLHEIDLNHFVLDIELLLYGTTSLKDIEPLKNPNIAQRVSCVKIDFDEDHAVMEVLFSLLSNISVHSLEIRASNIFEWIEHIRQIGSSLRELSINILSQESVAITTITEYCPNLEKLNWNCYAGITEKNILQSIGNSCPHLRSLHLCRINYMTEDECDADLTAFAMKCPLLENLSLHGPYHTNKSIAIIAQHFSRLKTFGMNWEDDFSHVSLIALSKRGLPLEELSYPEIRIPTVKIAAKCAHALSRIRWFTTGIYRDREDYFRNMIQYMTGLQGLVLNSSHNCLLVPYLLQHGHCTGLEYLDIRKQSNITSEQLSELVRKCPNLHTLSIVNSSCNFEAVLVDLPHICPHLNDVSIHCNDITEESILALAMHLKHLKELKFMPVAVTEDTVRKIILHCRHLTELQMFVMVRKLKNRTIQEYKRCYTKQIRAMRETDRTVALKF